jgi:hypothetical protein
MVQLIGRDAVLTEIVRRREVIPQSRHQFTSDPDTAWKLCLKNSSAECISTRDAVWENP